MKNKKMIYIRPENLEFYQGLENKSDFVNEALSKARMKSDNRVVAEEATESSNSGTAHEAVESMRERDARLLKEYREKKGLYDPTEN